LSKLTDEELVARLKKAKIGSDARKQLFEELWLKYEKTVDGMLWGSMSCSSAVDPEDIKSEIAIKLWSSIDKYQGKGTFASWLRQVVKGCIVDEIRKVTPLRHLFDLNVTEEMEKELNGGSVPMELRDMFKERKVSSLKDAVIRKQEDQWIISGKGTYIIRKEGAQLKIYRRRIVKKPAAVYENPEGDESETEVIDRLSNLIREPIDEGPEIELERKEEKEAIRKALNTMARKGKGEAKCARAIRWLHEEDWTKSAVANELRVSGATLNKLLDNNYKCLQNIMKTQSGKQINSKETRP